jgi:NAD-dependent DNA ligase
VSFERTVELPCGDYVELYVSGNEISVSVSDGSVETYLSSATAEELSQAFAAAAGEARENERRQILRGKRIVLTGKFEGGRDAVAARLRQAGGLVTNRITSGTIVLAGDIPYEGTWKSRKAEHFGATLRFYHELDGELQAVGL